MWPAFSSDHFFQHKLFARTLRTKKLTVAELKRSIFGETAGENQIKLFLKCYFVCLRPDFNIYVVIYLKKG